MQLPDITIPLSLPFDVPVLLHPVMVHFAVVLPLIVLILELANLIFKRRALSITSLALLLTAVLFYLAAYFTGKADGKEAYALLSPEGQDALKSHRLLGTYLVYALSVPLVFKLIAMLIAQKWARGLLLLTLVIFISFMIKQGFDGGELVYKYGANVQAVSAAQDALEDARYDLEDMNETLQEQAEEIKTLHSELEVLKAENNESFTDSVNQAVSDVVTKVKSLIGDENASQSEANASNGDDDIVAVDANDTGAVSE